MSRFATKCMAVVDGRRCRRATRSIVPVMYAWDAIKGVGSGGPDLCLCWQHGRRAFDECSLRPDRSIRIRVLDGWFGHVWNAEAKCWTVLTSVFARRNAHGYAKAWFRHRQPIVFGQCGERPTYDDVRGQR